MSNCRDEKDGILLCDGHTVTFNPDAEYGGVMGGCRVCVLERTVERLTRQVQKLRRALMSETEEAQ